MKKKMKTIIKIKKGEESNNMCINIENIYVRNKYLTENQSM